MSVPSHNLYDFLHQVTERRFLLFYFYPWGEKAFSAVKDYLPELEDIQGHNGLSMIDAERFVPAEMLDQHLIRNFQPVLLAHDQEPLFFDYYQSDGHGMREFLEQRQQSLDYPMGDQNLRACHHWSLYKRWILLHSEKNSTELAKYENTGRFIGAFWWSHAMLARDWYRFAEHDSSLLKSVDDKKLFLVYARDVTGSRTYRKEFLDSLGDIDAHCQIGSINKTTARSDSSAIYDSLDFASTEISIVLETLFQDDRIHLTEKILRPIACGHPFLLAAGPGSLEFLKSYGFQTFGTWIDESYDQEPDHDRRLQMIISEMRRIAGLDADDQKILLEGCRAIAESNKRYFFSDEFQNHIISELRQNIAHAWQQIQGVYDGAYWLKTRRWRKANRPGYFIDNERDQAVRTVMVPLVRHLRTHQGSLEQYQSHEHSLDNKSNANGHDV